MTTADNHRASRRVSGFASRHGLRPARRGIPTPRICPLRQRERRCGNADGGVVAAMGASSQKAWACHGGRRVEVLRPFLKYCRQFDPACPVLPLGLCGPGHRRLAPHIYTEAEVAALLVAARELKPDGLRPLTYVTLFGRWRRQGCVFRKLSTWSKDLNLKQSTLTVRETKFKKSRLVPIHVSTAKALARYRKTAPQYPAPSVRRSSSPSAADLFPENDSQHLRSFPSTVRLGCPRRPSATPNPRSAPHLHLPGIAARPARQPIDHVADAISTYVGHAKVSDTYWYISATPELMSIASQRFSRFSSGGCQ